MKLEQAFSAIRGSSALAEKFSSDPTGTLQGLGVDTSNLTVTPSSSTNTISRIPSASNANFCVSIGCGACASVG